MAIGIADAQEILTEMVAANAHVVAGYDENPVLALAKKVKFTGKHYDYEITYSRGSNRSRTGSVALAKTQKPKRVEFNVKTRRSYAAQDIDSQALDEVTGANAFVDMLDDILDGLNSDLVNMVGEDVFKNNGAARGQVGTVVSATVIELKNPNDIVRWNVDDEAFASETDGTSGALQAGSATVTAVDRDTGRLTTDGAGWVAQIALLDVDDFMFGNGEFGLGRDGLPSWIPDTTAGLGTAFNGAVRSADPTKLAGCRATYADGSSIVEAVRNLVTRIKREGGRPDTVAMAPELSAQLETELDNKVQYGELRGSNVDVGVPTIKLTAAGLTLNIVTDRSCNDDRFYLMRKDKFEVIHSTKQLVDVVDADGKVLSRNAADFSYDVRAESRANFIIREPWHFGVGLFV
jgi:hypothetical protein